MSRILKRIGRRTSAIVRGFSLAKRGNVSIIFGLSLIPLIGLVGLGVDYGVALSNKSKLDNAADAAAVAAVATAKAYVAANSNDPNVARNAITAGTTQAMNAFAVNAGSVAFASVPTPVVTLTRTGQTFSSSVSYTTSTQNHFGQIFGQRTFALKGGAAASADVPKYLDLYLLLDVSGSMGLPSTPAGQAQLAAINSDGFPDFQQGCMFACHYPGSTGWWLATNPVNNIELRSGSVHRAVCSLLQTAQQQAQVPNQYRVGIYPFINQMAPLPNAELTNNLASLWPLAQCDQPTPMTFTNLLDSGNPNSAWGAGGTHFEIVLPQMQQTIVSYGDGASPSTPKPFVFLVTDGMDNAMTFNYSSGFSGSQPSPLDPVFCQNLKNAGATLSVLYIPYLYIKFVPNGGINSTESTKVNAFSPSLPNLLLQCASPGFFYQANSPADITNSLNAMFNQAVQVAHLTQ